MCCQLVATCLPRFPRRVPWASGPQEGSLPSALSSQMCAAAVCVPSSADGVGLTPGACTRGPWVHSAAWSSRWHQPGAGSVFWKGVCPGEGMREGTGGEKMVGRWTLLPPQPPALVGRGLASCWVPCKGLVGPRTPGSTRWTRVFTLAEVSGLS